MLKIKILWIFLAAIVFLIGAVWWVITPSEKDRAMFTEDEKRRCLDNFCQGDVMPKSYESVQKINHQWFIGPREYFNGFGAAHFIWWDHKPLGQKISYPSEIQRLAEDGKSDIFQIPYLEHIDIKKLVKNLKNGDNRMTVYIMPLFSLHIWMKTYTTKF